MRVTEFDYDNQIINTKFNESYTTEDNVNIKKRSNSSLPVMMNHFRWCLQLSRLQAIAASFPRSMNLQNYKGMALELYSKQ